MPKPTKVRSNAYASVRLLLLAAAPNLLSAFLATLCIAASLFALIRVLLHGWLPAWFWWLSTILLTAEIFFFLSCRRVSGWNPGIRLAEPDYPALFGELNRIASEVGVPAIHSVNVTYDCNAAAWPEIETWWLPLRIRFRLSIGLPLLLSLPPDECGAVIAHELGHFAGNHPATYAWTSMLRARWSVPPDMIYLPSLLSGRLQKLRQVYSHFLEREFLSLRRRDEFGADATAARIVGPERYSSMMLRLQLQSRAAADDFAAARARLVPLHPLPPETFFTHYLRSFTSPLEEGYARSSIPKLLSGTSVESTHPSCGDRIRAILPGFNLDGALEMIPDLVRGFNELDEEGGTDASGAEEWLSREQRVALAHGLGVAWALHGNQAWQEEHSLHSDRSRRLRWLDQESGSRSLSRSESIERSRLHHAMGDADQGVELASALRETNPEDAEVAFLLAGMVSSTDPDESISILEPYLGRLEQLLPLGIYEFRTLSDSLRRENRPEDAKVWLDRSDTHLFQFSSAFATSINAAQLRPCRHQELCEDIARRLSARNIGGQIYFLEARLSGALTWHPVLFLVTPPTGFLRKYLTAPIDAEIERTKILVEKIFDDAVSVFPQACTARSVMTAPLDGQVGRRLGEFAACRVY